MNKPLVHKVGEHVAFYCLRMESRDQEPDDYGGDTAQTRYQCGTIVGPTELHDPGFDWKILPDGFNAEDGFFYNRADWELMRVHTATK